ncbi:MAG: [protein release factor]-glutamine N5-methyltransferase [Candidatus Berkelbacteria bacterium Athens1014_28]|uniref:[protein release factor]-glutamine N5-methyltransferase n=1 Tax=Candidatus Berkelbacteria bacterium Athens1014_28 TaxID=2017145 RepID=A0A554LM98_9BACT|nr:MAG: [protein release factor]-glutamine N5-methyltransferase [Candidatus Berkelbacteria bacterium Athens1014_28]
MLKKKSILSFLKQQIAILKDSDINSAEIDAEIILEFVTGKSREFLLAHPKYELSKDQKKVYGICVDRRKSHIPIAYITGHKEFFGLDFFVTPDVLIPRPETEMLVEEVIKFIKLKVYQVDGIKSPLKNAQINEELAGNFPARAGKFPEQKQLKIIDIGTGSGNIIISIAKALNLNLPSLNFYASDISEKALKIAKKNAKFHQVADKIKFYKSDLFANKNLPRKFDVIVANLPYVPENKSKIKNQKSKLRSSDLLYEPQNAIFASDNGTKIIKKFLDQTQNRINKNGLILTEVDPRNAKKLQKFAKLIFRDSKIELIKDYAGLDRIIKILLRK